ncbi:hypothetical protein C8R46DRAFT_989772 [Mycena filopes]|nr:hypothetical protein C8R46DRAFT_989772 [Mycena filopes]
MPIPWPSRFFLLLVPCVFGLYFFLSFRTHVETTGILLDKSPVAADDALGSDTTETGNATRILLVSAFFPLAKSKHTTREYEEWLSKYLQPITTDIYFYAPVAMAELIRKCRGDMPIIIDTTYSSPFDIPPLRNSRAQYSEMYAQDRERALHSPDLYAVWNAKPFFLDKAVHALSRAGRDYDYAFWNDAGSFRTSHSYQDWPDPARTREIWKAGSRLSGEKEEDLLFFPIAGLPDPSLRYWTESHGPVDTELSEGSFFGGSPTAIAWWKRTFYAYHDHYLKLGIFVGKDQTLINALFLLFPSRIIAVWLDDPEAPGHADTLPFTDKGALGNCGPEWFYYQFWFARWSERREMQSLWQARWSWGWWRSHNECRVTRVTSMRDLLERVFGIDWEPPLHNVTA